MQSSSLALLITCTLSAAAGCSYVFDSSAPDLPLVGSAPNPFALPRLNHAPVSRSGILPGVDGTPWAALLEGKRWRLVHLAAPAADELVSGDLVQLVGDAFYVQTKRSGASGMAQLAVHVAGASSDVTFNVPDVAPVIVAAPPSVFAWFGDGIDHYQLIDRHGAWIRDLPLPSGVDPSQPRATGAQRFTRHGSYFLERDATGRLIARATRGDGDHDVDLGIHAGVLAIGAGDDVWECAADGLWRLDPATITIERHDDQCRGLVALDGDTVYYQRSDSLWRADAATTTAARVTDLPDGARPIGVFAAGARVAYSTDPAERYIYGAGDGWLVDWRFMERGLGVRLSADGTRIFWLEHAADAEAIGELMSATLSDRRAAPLIRNARNYDELPDGRLIVEANQAAVGATSRVVVVDLQRHEARLVLSSANYFTRIPNSNDVLVGVVGAYELPEHDIVRLTLPGYE